MRLLIFNYTSNFFLSIFNTDEKKVNEKSLKIRRFTIFRIAQIVCRSVIYIFFKSR